MYLLRAGKPNETGKNHLPTYMSSRGEMKISLRLMTCNMFSGHARGSQGRGVSSYVLMAQVLQKLQFAVCALGKDRRAEGLHDLLDRDSRAGELVLGRTVPGVSDFSPPFHSDCRSALRLTTQDRRRPCPRAEDPSI